MFLNKINYNCFQQNKPITSQDAIKKDTKIMFCIKNRLKIIVMSQEPILRSKTIPKF